MATINHLYLMKIAPQIGFLIFYVMGPAEIHLYGIADVKEDFIALPKMYVIPRVGKFVWTTGFAQCVHFAVVMFCNKNQNFLTLLFGFCIEFFLVIPSQTLFNEMLIMQIIVYVLIKLLTQFNAICMNF